MNDATVCFRFLLFQTCARSPVCDRAVSNGGCDRGDPLGAARELGGRNAGNFRSIMSYLTLQSFMDGVRLQSGGPRFPSWRRPPAELAQLPRPELRHVGSTLSEAQKQLFERLAKD